MKLSALIAQLTAHKELHGDLDCKIQIQDFNSGELFVKTYNVDLERFVINEKTITFEGDKTERD